MLRARKSGIKDPTRYFYIRIETSLRKKKAERSCALGRVFDFGEISVITSGRAKIFQKRVVSEPYVDWLLKQPDLIDGDISASGDKKLNYYSNGWWTARVFEKNIFYARGFRGQYVVVLPDLDLVFVRLGMFEDDSSSLSNDYTLTDDLLFLIESVIKNFS